MSDGFVHEYEGSTSEEETPITSEKPKRERTPKQQAATAKALEALSARRSEAAAAKSSKAAAKAPAAKPPAKPPVAATPAPPPSAPAAAAGAGVSPPNPLAHATDARPAFDPLMIAEIVKREIELQKAKERELGWHKTKKASKSRRRARSESSDDDSDDSVESYDERPSRVLAPRKRKASNVLPDPRDEVGGPPTDFFDRLMARSSKFNPW